MTIRRQHRKKLAKKQVLLNPAYVEGEVEANPPVKYVPVSAATYTLDESDLTVGTTIYGVNAGANATFNLVLISDPTKIVEIVNESDTYSLIINEP